MSCDNCHYISGHSSECPHFAEQTAGDVDDLKERVRAAEAKLEAVERALDNLASCSPDLETLIEHLRAAVKS